jgi:hypothetical protein
MREIGRIKQVQIQRSSLKIQHGSQDYYHPEPLLVVSHLLLSPQGVIGVTADGDELLDVHNADHPASRNHDGFNGISFGFTRSYEEMRAYAGPHLTDGIAGENILIEAPQAYTEEDLQDGLIIQSHLTGDTIVLTEIGMAYPCIAFSTFALHEPEPSAKQIKTTLQFLHNGRRGFYASIAQEARLARVQAGDLVLIL